MSNPLSISLDNFVFAIFLVGFERYAGRWELSRWFKVSQPFEEMCSYAFYLSLFLSEHRQQKLVEGGRLFHFIFTLFIFYLSLSSFLA